MCTKHKMFTQTISFTFSSDRKLVALESYHGLFIYDWETAGRYPEHWECTPAIFSCVAWANNRHKYKEKYFKSL